MKGYKNFVIIFSALFILYVIAEINKPKPVDWTVTLSRYDKNPYGGYVLYNQLASLFPGAAIQSSLTSVYSRLKTLKDSTNTAYFIIGSTLRPSDIETNRMKKYVSNGNYIIASANLFYTPFLDSLGVETDTRMSFRRKDSTTINFVNPALKEPKNYAFLQGTIDQYFSSIDTLHTTIISVNNYGYPIYIKVPYGKGAFLIHTAPITFTNYFLLFRHNASYTSKTLSYLPQNITKIYWDEYKKMRDGTAKTPFRFFLSNEYLRWALRLALIGIILYVLFQMKRRQRVIPVINPLKNSTLDFVKTVASVYYNEKDNYAIAVQKISHFLEFVRNRFNIATQTIDESFAEQLQRKSGLDTEEIEVLVSLLETVPTQGNVTDKMLLNLNRNIDNFYKQV